MAVNVADVPGQIVVADAATATDGTGAGNTFIVIPVDVTETGFAHGALEVMITVTTWPLVRLLVENVGLLVPVLVPFTCH